MLNYAVLDRSEAHSSRPRTYLPSRSGATHALRVQSSIEAGYLRTLRTNAHPGNAAVEKIQVYAHLKNVFMTNKHRNVLITSITLAVHSQVIVDSARECWATLCLVYGGCTGYALRRGDLHSGTLRDGNHKPTISSAGALGLKLECTSEWGGVCGVYGRAGSQESRMGSVIS